MIYGINYKLIILYMQDSIYIEGSISEIFCPFTELIGYEVGVDEEEVGLITHTRKNSVGYQHEDVIAEEGYQGVGKLLHLGSWEDTQ